MAAKSERVVIMWWPKQDRADEKPSNGNSGQSVNGPTENGPYIDMPAVRRLIREARGWLADVAWILFIVWILVMIRSTLTAVDELHKLRLAITTQVAESGTSIALPAKEIASDIQKLNVTANVLIDRLDSQLGKTRAQLHDAAQTANQSASADRKVVEKVLKPAADAVAAAASELTDTSKEQQQKPVVVQPAPVIVQPVAPPAVVQPPEEPDDNSSPVSEPVKKAPENVWRKLWRKLHFRSKD